MNLFILDNDLKLCAEYHVDKHIVKMPLEAAQLLCTAHYIEQSLGYTPRALTSQELKLVEYDGEFYKPTHPNHPCSIWLRSSVDNIEWTYNYAYNLNDEYGFRYGKSHKSIDVINKLPYSSIPSVGLTKFAQALPVKMDDAVEAYRSYYLTDKKHLAAWKNRDKPYWWENG